MGEDFYMSVWKRSRILAHFRQGRNWLRPQRLSAQGCVGRRARAGPCTVAQSYDSRGRMLGCGRYFWNANVRACR